MSLRQNFMTPLPYLVASIFLVHISPIKTQEPSKQDCLPDQLKSVVSIRKGSSHICTGTLISQKWVLTVAHCEESDLHVVAGLSEKVSHRVTSKVKAFYVHPRYSYPPDDDIAMVYLETPINETTSISYATLPDAKSNVTCPNAVAMGWGRLWLKESTLYPKNFQCFTVSTMPQSTCGTHLFWLVEDTLLCSLTKGADKTCMDDYGGPVMCDGVLIGIVAWQIECGEPFTPGLYARVDKYLGFIKSANSAFKTFGSDVVVNSCSLIVLYRAFLC